MPGGMPIGGAGFPGNMSPYMNPFSSSGMTPGCMGGMCSYNPWFSGMNNQFNAGGLPSFYNNMQGQVGGQVRLAQQQAISQQDSMVAQQALYGAQSRYGQVLGSMNGSYYGGYSPYSSYGGGYSPYSTYGGGYSPYSAYGGYGSSGYGYYNPAYSGYGTGYYSAGAMVSNPPGLTPIRE
jgi:hypothetical protein